MSNEHPYRPCPSCGGVEFESLPDLAVDLYTTKLRGALPGMVKMPGCQALLFSLVVCTACGKTDFYTKNAAKIAQASEGASHFRAASRSG